MYQKQKTHLVDKIKSLTDLPSAKQFADQADMKLQLHLKMNEALFLRDPQSSELGKNILKHSVQLIYKNGFEAFTFKKLAADIGTTEAGIYRYFENKHKLLVYLTAWYWGWLEFQISFHIGITRQ